MKATFGETACGHPNAVKLGFDAVSELLEKVLSALFFFMRTKSRCTVCSITKSLCERTNEKLVSGLFLCQKRDETRKIDHPICCEG
jgi:hypothetical protein